LRIAGCAVARSDRHLGDGAVRLGEEGCSEIIFFQDKRAFLEFTMPTPALLNAVRRDFATDRRTAAAG
jgi:hypothetical protein